MVKSSSSLNDASTPVGVFFFTEDIVFSIDHEDNISACLLRAIEDHGKELGCINVIFCSDEFLLEMNKEYLNHDYFTDILSFPMSREPLSGDLFISVDRVKDYSKTNNVDFSVEMNRVIIHGILHFLDYNDKSDEERLEMRSKEDFYLELLLN